MNEKYPLPPGWAWASPDDIAAGARHSLGIGPFGSDLKVSDYATGGVPLVFVRNIRSGSFGGDGDKFVSPEKAEALAAHRVTPGDLLITKMGAPPGDVCLYPAGKSDGIITADCVRLRFDRRLECREYFVYAIRSECVRNQILDRTIGVAQQKISLERFKSVRIPVAPAAEQIRLVEQVDSHLTRIDAGVAALTRLQANLKRYRASVLKAACEGKLVPTEAELARAEGRDYEPADKLLARILVERRARWEAEQLARMNAKGQVPKDAGWKTKYEEPVELSARGLSELPEGWKWTCLDALSSLGSRGAIDQGWSPKCESTAAESEDEWAVIKTTAVQAGKFLANENKRLPSALEPRPEIQIVAGDLLMTRAGPRVRVGVTCLVKQSPKGLMLCDKVYRLRLIAHPSLPSFVEASLQAPDAMDRLNDLKTGISDSGVNLTQQGVLAFAIAMPPLAEQQRIVTEVERTISVIDAVEQTIQVQLIRAQGLRQAVLKRAFEGKLVPQDPTDEPASVLLARIRAERATAQERGEQTRKPRAVRGTLRQEATPGGQDDG